MNILNQVISHYDKWTDDNDTRRSRKNGWDDITAAYWGRLPNDWPYNTKVVDPRIRTTILEKNARLFNSKLKGRLVPREGGDLLKAKINNALLDFQWDVANYGGTMLSKWSMADQDTRLYASKFAYVYWRTDYRDGKLAFEGNEFMPLDIRNCGIDPTSNNIRDAKWFQYRRWEKIDDLEEEHKKNKRYPGLGKLIEKIKNGEEYGQDRRDARYQSKLLSIKGLDDRVGDDDTFPVLEIVTEFRQDKTITFSPRHKVVIEEVPNQYKHSKIPVIQLKYYPLNDDPLGESEVEPVIPLWKAINAVLCSHLDGLDLRQKPPVMIREGAARLETIILGPEARWIVSSMDAVMEAPIGKSSDNSFQADYGALVSAFNTAMGDMSQGTSVVDPFDTEKTATEVRASVKQQNTRDQSNQTKLAEAIQDMMMMWLSNNKQFLFTDPTKQEFLLNILGEDQFNFFKQSGLDEMEIPIEVEQDISQYISDMGGNVSDLDIDTMREAGKIPRYPVKSGKSISTKLEVDGNAAKLHITPEDLDGSYDYVPDVVSMAVGANEEMRQGQRMIMETALNPAVQQMLLQEGVKIKVKDILISNFENNGEKDASRFFETIEPSGPSGPNAQGAGLPAGIPTPGTIPGMAEPSAPIPQGNAGGGMAPPIGLPQ